MRPIDADALKEKYTMVTKRYSGGIMECPAVLLESIDSAPTIDAVSEWIPCSERLPREYSDGERVLATTDVDGLGVIIIPIYDVTSWYYKGYISAWMPLPKPWKERKRNEHM